MTIIHLVCPQCRNQNAYEEANIDVSNDITCSACGYSGLPTSFELPKGHPKTSWQIAKIVIITLVGIGFLFGGLTVLVSALFSPPIIIAVVIVIILYRRWKE